MTATLTRCPTCYTLIDAARPCPFCAPPTITLTDTQQQTLRAVLDHHILVATEAVDALAKHHPTGAAAARRDVQTLQELRAWQSSSPVGLTEAAALRAWVRSYVLDFAREWVSDYPDDDSYRALLTDSEALLQQLTPRRTAAEWQEEVAATVARAKLEILADIAAGRVPASVRTFSELHDYVDANEYGGLCEDDSTFTERYREGECKPSDVGSMTEATMHAANRVQDLVSEWLEAGRPV